MSDNSSGAGPPFDSFLAALNAARERVLDARARYPYTRGLRNEAAVDDPPETAEQRRQRKAAERAQRDARTAQLAADAAAQAVKALDEQNARKVDPNARPDFDTADPESGTPLPDNLKSAAIPRGPNVGKILQFPLTPGGLRGHTTEGGETVGALVDKALDKHISINRFPRDFDAGDFSMARYCMATELSKNTFDGNLAFQKWAPKEAAFYEALSYYGKESKALGEMTSGQDGGFLAPEIWTNVFFDMLYPAQVMSRLPITRMMMGGRVQHIPKLTSQVTIAYAAENAALNASQPQFSQLSFTARKQYAFIQIPNELIRDSAPAADQVIFQHAQTRMAVDRDTQLLFGNGQAGAPVGLINATNVGSYTIAADVGNGGSPTYSDFVSIINLVRQLNNSTNVPVGQTDCTGVVGAVRVEQTIAALKDTNNRPLWAYGLNQIGRVPAPGWLGVPNWVLTNVVPTNVTKGGSSITSYLIGGDWQYLVYMMRQDVEFLATNVGGTSFQNDQTWIRLISRYDVGVIHPEAFTVSGGVLV